MDPVGLADLYAVWFIEQKLPWSKVKVDVWLRDVEGDTALIVIEGMDPVTNLRHEIIRKLVVQNEQIVFVLKRGKSSG